MIICEEIESPYTSVRERTGCEEKTAPATIVDEDIAVLQLKYFAGPASTTTELPAPAQTESEPKRERDYEIVNGMMNDGITCRGLEKNGLGCVVI